MSIINTLKQSGVCCSQIMTLLLPLDADPAPFLAALPSANPAL